jgi:hypothetical protein
MATTTPTLPSKPTTLGRQPKYYEADGALRAYATRSLWIAAVAVIAAVVSLIGLIAVRMQKPTLIRELPSGETVIIGADGSLHSALSPSNLAQIANDQAPTDLDKEYWVRTALDSYLNYDEHSLSSNWSHAFNMMTSNLRNQEITQLQKNGLVARYEDQHERSAWKVIRVVHMSPLVYSVTGDRLVHHITGGQTEVTEDLMETYTVRLTEVDRGRQNPSGLLVADIEYSQLQGDSKEAHLNSGNNQENNQ